MSRSRIPSLKRGGGQSTKVLGPGGILDETKRGYVPGNILVQRSPVNPLHGTFHQFAELFKGSFRHRENTGDSWVAGRLPYVDKMCDWVGITRQQYCNTARRPRVTHPFTVFLFALACRRKTHHHPTSILDSTKDERLGVDAVRERARVRRLEDDKARTLEVEFVQELRRQLPTRRAVIRLLTQIAERSTSSQQLGDRLIYALQVFGDAYWPEYKPPIPRITPLPIEGIDPWFGERLDIREAEAQAEARAVLDEKEERQDAWLEERDVHRWRKLRIKMGGGDGTTQGQQE